MKKLLLLFFVLLLFLKNSFGEVTAWLENNPVTVGQMFNLYVEAKNVNDVSEPDLKNLKGLQVLNQSTQNQTSIVGNKITRTIKWTYTLLASSRGEYQIPSLKVGNETTNSIVLKVDDTQEKNNNKIVYLDMNISPKKVYPQQQVIASLKIIRNGFQLVNESITPFEIEGARVEKIKESSYQKVKNGVKQLITEIIYVLIPEKSGRIVIPEVRYQGDEITGINLGGIFQKFGSYSQNRGKRIFSKSTTQFLEVIPIPKNFRGWWLPVKELTIDEKWYPGSNEFRVGEPVTRTITISANGVYGDQIPELKINSHENLKGYVDKPQINTEKNQFGIQGMRTEKWALIPSKPGKVVLPQILVSWWDVTNDELQNTIIPSRIIEVLPAMKNYSKNIINSENNTDTIKNINDLENISTNEIKQIYIWKVLSTVFAIFWMLTIFFWYLTIRNKKIKQKKLNDSNENNHKNNVIKETKKLKELLITGSPKTIKLALLNWSKCVWKNDPPKHLEQISDRIPELNKGIKLLNNALYGKNKEEVDISNLRREFVSITIPKENNVLKKKSYLSNLYPDSLGF